MQKIRDVFLVFFDFFGGRVVVFQIFTFEQKIENKAAIDLSISGKKIKELVLFFRMAFMVAHWCS